MQDQVTELSLLFGFIQRHAALVKQLDCALSPHGISFTEFSVLHQLQLAPQQTLRRVELAGTVGLSASGVTRLLLPMEKIGLVDREANPRDARVSLVRMTRAGRTLPRVVLLKPVEPIPCTPAKTEMTNP